VPDSTQNGRVMQFGVFEVDLQASELRKSGLRIKLQEQPFQILALLLEHPGEVVTREQLRQRLWPADTFVDFDHSLNSAVKKLRLALADDSDNPRFVETLPRRGYRLIAPVRSAALASDQVAGEIPPVALRTKGISNRNWLIIFGGIVTVASLALWQTVTRGPSVPRVLRFTALTNDGQAKDDGLASDGTRIYFTETLPDQRTAILQVPINGGEAVALSVPLKQPRVLDLSPDGTELLVASELQTSDPGAERGSLWVLPVAGGSPRRVGTVTATEASFGPKGASIIYANGNDIYSVDRDGSSPQKLLTSDNTPFAFRFSPDARVLRFTQYDYLVDTMDIMEAAADGTGVHKVISGSCGEWNQDRRFFIFRNMTNSRLDVWALPEARGFQWRRRDDKPIQLTAGPLNLSCPLPSKDGKQIFAVGGTRRAEVIRYDSRSGQFVPYLSGISAEGLAFSRDGQWVTYTAYPENTLWRSKVDGSERLQLTFAPMRVSLPHWSPDGTQIVFNASAPHATSSVYLVPSEGGTPQRVFPSKLCQTDANWSPDGDSLVFGTCEVSNMPIYVIDLKSRRVVPLPGSNGLFSPRWSPDGKYIAALTTDTAMKLMLFTFANQKWSEAFDSEVGYPLWSHDGKYIYVQDKRHAERIVRLRLSDRKLENVVDIKNLGRLTTGTFVDWFGLAPDDSPLFARDISTSEIYGLDVQWP
jgi:DNA-binding winged helix-turn-helix (wHTH) protein/Tol biopolymer transport system component